MRILKTLVIVVIVLFGAAAIGVGAAGVLLPSTRSFGNEIDIDAPAEAVWQVVTDKESYTEWQTALDRVEIIDDKSWIEYPKNTPEPLKFRLVEDGRPHRMEFEYTMGDSMHGSWKGEVTHTAKGVKLRTLDAYHTDGFLMKVLMGAFFDLDSFAKDWNNKLKARVEQQHRSS